jgi:predicted TPR repeat methyltransferase
MSEKHFDKAAAGWDQKQRRIEMAAKIAGAISSTLPLTQTMRAMEYGCGTGLVGLALAPQLASLTAVDTSAGMLEILARKIDDEKIGNVIPMRLNLLDEPCTDRFDLIFSAMVLHHVQETDKILARLCDLLVEGGYLAVADLWEEDGSFHDANVEGVMHHGFNPADLAKRLGALGIQNVSYTEVHSIIKTNEAGNERGYPVFLLTGRKG